MSPHLRTGREGTITSKTAFERLTGVPDSATVMWVGHSWEKRDYWIAGYDLAVEQSEKENAS